MTISEFFKKIFSRMLFGNCLGIVIITIVLAFTSLLFINLYTHHGREVIVPNVCGLNQDVAQKKLEALGLRMEVTDTGYVYNAAPFSVLEQNLKPGDKVKPGRIMFEIDGVSEELARSAFALGAAKLPVKSKFIKRLNSDMPKGEA